MTKTYDLVVIGSGTHHCEQSLESDAPPCESPRSAAVTSPRVTNAPLPFGSLNFRFLPNGEVLSVIQARTSSRHREYAPMNHSASP